jgi:hypothetical protein
MGRLALAFSALFCIGSSALGQTLECSQFRHNQDGSWTPISLLTVTSGAYGDQKRLPAKIWPPG